MKMRYFASKVNILVLYMFFYYFLTESFTILNIWRFYQKNYRSKSAGKDSCHKYEILYKKIIIITDKY